MNKQNRQLATVVAGQNTSDGAGVKLKRVINPQQHKFDPFILFDEFGSDEPADYIGGFPPHPHRGFETVTYMLEGAMLHRDHLGNEGHLRKGDVQWMTAASGVVHEEWHEQAFTKRGGILEMVQLWVNLPAKDKMSPPRYQEILSGQIPTVALPGGVAETAVVGVPDRVRGEVPVAYIVGACDAAAAASSARAEGSKLPSNASVNTRARPFGEQDNRTPFRDSINEPRTCGRVPSISQPLGYEDNSGTVLVKHGILGDGALSPPGQRQLCSSCSVPAVQTEPAGIQQ